LRRGLYSDGLTGEYDMTISRRLALGAALLCLSPVSFGLPVGALAQGFEQPPSFSPDKIPGLRPSGTNYTVKSPVRSDGLLRVYVLATPYGDITVHGDQMLKMRLNELVALAELEKVAGSDAFAKSLVEAGLSPVKYTGRLITNPIGTVGNTLAGVGALFGRLGSGVANAGKTQDNAMAGLLGVTSQKRQLAAKYGVDPYTDFVPLNAKLNQLSEAAALGGLVVTGALMAIPGAAGVVVSNLSTAYKLGDVGIEELARNYTAAQILDLNRQRLAAMGVDRTLAEELLANRAYTPIDLAAMVAALDSMTGVPGRELFVARAAAANGRSIAYFMRRQAELLADDNARTRSLTRFVSLGGYPFNVTRDGRVTGLMPVDALSWTQGTATGFTNASNDRKATAPNTRAELRITGQATATAKKQMKQLGWTVVENARP
jgi:hypothetical protein